MLKSIGKIPKDPISNFFVKKDRSSLTGGPKGNIFENGQLMSQR